jgi:hypothetical protein
VSRRKEREREGEEYLRWVMPLLRVSMSAIGLPPCSPKASSAEWIRERSKDRRVSLSTSPEVREARPVTPMKQPARRRETSSSAVLSCPQLSSAVLECSFIRQWSSGSEESD